MKTTRNGNVAPYLGADLSDRYARDPRAIDVCGLSALGDGRFDASFYAWIWDAPGPLDATAIVDEISSAVCAMLDAPQGLAAPGQSMRECERQCGAAGKTPCTRPRLSRCYAGFIHSSLDLFEALERGGCGVSRPNFAKANEYYPGAAWRRLCGRSLPRKDKPEGLIARRRLLEALGVQFRPKEQCSDHDRADACLGAVLAAAANGKVAGVRAQKIGSPLSIDPNGTLPEGPIVMPDVEDDLKQKLRACLQDIPEPQMSRQRRAAKSESEGHGPPALGNGERDRSQNLLYWLIHETEQGRSTLVDYHCAYWLVTQHPYEKHAQAFSQRILVIASNCEEVELPGLGPVRLDAFIVGSKTRLPSSGHWPKAHYTKEEWERLFGNAAVLRCRPSQA